MRDGYWWWQFSGRLTLLLYSNSVLCCNSARIFSKDASQGCSYCNTLSIGKTCLEVILINKKGSCCVMHLFQGPSPGSLIQFLRDLIFVLNIASDLWLVLWSAPIFRKVLIGGLKYKKRRLMMPSLMLRKLKSWLHSLNRVQTPKREHEETALELRRVRRIFLAVVCKLTLCNTSSVSLDLDHSFTF
jgi:hypothetical protein